MTKAEFSKHAENTIRDLYAMAKEITPDIGCLNVRISINDEYESFTVDAGHFPDGEFTYLLKGSHFICKLDNGGEIHKEDVA